jgi:hypothetical protein
VDVACRAFSVRDDVSHHVLHAGGTIDFSDVEGFLLELASRFDVREVRFDPRFLERSMEVLAARLPGSAVAPVEPYTNAHRQSPSTTCAGLSLSSHSWLGSPTVPEMSEYFF